MNSCVLVSHPPILPPSLPAHVFYTVQHLYCSTKKASESLICFYVFSKYIPKDFCCCHTNETLARAQPSLLLVHPSLLSQIIFHSQCYIKRRLYYHTNKDLTTCYCMAWLIHLCDSFQFKVADKTLLPKFMLYNKMTLTFIPSSVHYFVDISWRNRLCDLSSTSIVNNDPFVFHVRDIAV